MKQLKINKNYLHLKNWWETFELTNYEKSFFNREIISFNQQLFRLKEKQISCLLYTSPSPRDSCASRMPSSA